MTTTQKFRNFVDDPIGDKSVLELPGIGGILGTRLQAAGVDKAYIVLGHYLVLKKNKEAFQNWMKDTCKAQPKQSLDCYQSLHEWSGKFLN
ncbi:barrier-to-autointegration factor-like [Athalia rosae]|uniref:barrier-to-autointegration factor-like n=1 Tax=Athalia rosae TaxID=37344 RepID=UPI0006252391|nr:barrier-to-autointegration factor-like [Athalia rosae]